MQELDREEWLFFTPRIPIRFNRFMLIIPALVVQICAGSLYCWSIFNTPGDAIWATQGYKSGTNTNAFTIAVAFFGYGSAIFGPWISRWGPWYSVRNAIICLPIGWAGACLGHYQQVSDYRVCRAGLGAVACLCRCQCTNPRRPTLRRPLPLPPSSPHSLAALASASVPRLQSVPIMYIFYGIGQGLGGCFAYVSICSMIQVRRSASMQRAASGCCFCGSAAPASGCVVRLCTHCGPCCCGWRRQTRHPPHAHPSSPQPPDPLSPAPALPSPLRRRTSPSSRPSPRATR